MIGLNKTATLQRATTLQDDFGVPVQTWTTVGVVECRLVAVPYREQAELVALAGGQHTISSHKVYLPANSSVMIGDRLVIDTRTYTVLAVEDIDGMGRHIEAHVAAIEGVMA